MSDLDDSDFARSIPRLKTVEELERRIAELTEKLAAAEAFVANLGAEVASLMGRAELDGMLAKERQAGRDSYQKELREQEPIGYTHSQYKEAFARHGQTTITEQVTDDWNIPLFTHPQPPNRRGQ